MICIIHGPSVQGKLVDAYAATNPYEYWAESSEVSTTLPIDALQSGGIILQ